VGGCGYDFLDWWVGVVFVGGFEFLWGSVVFLLEGFELGLMIYGEC
jgi:hypothetical protein